MNKSEGSKDIHRGFGSADIAASVRSILLVEIDKKDKKRYVRAIKSNFDESDNTPVELVFDKNRRLSFQEKESDDIVEEHDFTQIEHASIILNTLFFIDEPSLFSVYHLSDNLCRESPEV